MIFDDDIYQDILSTSEWVAATIVSTSVFIHSSQNISIFSADNIESIAISLDMSVKAIAS